jgi:hypothetical protein
MVLSEVYLTYMISIVYDFVEDESCHQESKLSCTVTGDRITFSECVVLLLFFVQLKLYKFWFVVSEI